MRNTINSRLWGTILAFMSVVAVACPAHGVLMVNIDQCNQAFNFYKNDYETVPVNESIRVITFDTEQQEIESVDYLLAPTNRDVYKHKLNSCEIEYSFQQTPPSITIYPAGEFKGIYRSFGKFEGIGECKSLKDPESLKGWDHTRPHWQVFFQDKFQHKTIQEISLHLNQFDHPSQTTNWKVPHKAPLKACLHLRG